jgi:aminopeptidase N
MERAAMRISFLLFSLLFTAACSTSPLVPTTATTPTIEAAATLTATRSDATTDSSRPLSDNMTSYDVEHYGLRTEVHPEEKSISGSVAIRIVATKSMLVLELDFDGLFTIDSVEDGSGALEYTRDDAKLYVTLRERLAKDATDEVTISYHGQPLEAERPPWDGGFVWEETPSGKPWIATAVQGEGCDVWFPCKDHPAGEPLSADFYYTVPLGLTAAGNGVLISVEPVGDDRQAFHWRTEVATNTYGIALNVGPYVLIEGSYTSSNGTEIPLQFWAIEEHAEQAQELFDREFASVIEFFERKLGPYPWGQEKLGVAETPHLGMEHQTINAYGNEFARGEFGFDWLFHHELAHEWFGNVMTHVTVSDMWLHEGTGAFMQPEYAREVLGDAAYYAGIYGTYQKISACNAIAPREEFSADQLVFDDPDGEGPGGDIYSKGVWLLTSLRYVIGEEAFWTSIRRLIYDTPNPAELKPPIQPRFRSTDDFMRIASEESGQDLAWFFEVYARRGPLPVLSNTQIGDDLVLEWENVDDLPFPMPVPVRFDGKIQRIEFEENKATLTGTSQKDILIDPFMRVLRKLSIVPTCEERRAEEAEEEEEQAEAESS